MSDIILTIIDKAQKKANRLQVPVYLFMSAPASLEITTIEPDLYFERFNPIPARRL